MAIRGRTGDVNADTIHDLSDVVYLIAWGFLHGRQLPPQEGDVRREVVVSSSREEPQEGALARQIALGVEPGDLDLVHPRAPQDPTLSSPLTVAPKSTTVRASFQVLPGSPGKR